VASVAASSQAEGSSILAATDLVCHRFWSLGPGGGCHCQGQMSSFSRVTTLSCTPPSALGAESSVVQGSAELSEVWL
jgi:hypothetical protein